MKEENERLNTKLASLDELVREYEEKLGTIPILQEKIRALEKMHNAVSNRQGVSVIYLNLINFRFIS